MAEEQHGEGVGGNADPKALKSFVDRLFDIEQGFADQKAEYQDSKNDLKGEIKGRAEETGVEFKRVVDLVKIRMNEATALDEQARTNSNMETYESIYGFSAETSTAEDDEDALG